MMLTRKFITFTLAALFVSCAWVIEAAPLENNIFTVAGDELEYDIESGNGKAKGHVVITDKLGRAKGDYAEFNSKSKNGVLRGNVIADREDMHIVCDEFIIYNEEDMTARGSVELSKEGKKLQAERVDYFKGRGFAETVGSWAKLTDVDGSVLDAEKIDYDINNGLVQAYNNVTFESSVRKLSGSADNAIYDTKNGGVVDLIGNAHAIQEGNAIQGNKLRLTNSGAASADGSVKIIYIPEPKQPETTIAEGQQGAGSTEEELTAQGPLARARLRKQQMELTAFTQRSEQNPEEKILLEKEAELQAQAEAAAAATSAAEALKAEQNEQVAADSTEKAK